MKAFVQQFVELYFVAVLFSSFDFWAWIYEIETVILNTSMCMCSTFCMFTVYIYTIQYYRYDDDNDDDDVHCTYTHYVMVTCIKNHKKNMNETE